MFNNTTIFKHFQSRDHEMTSLSIRSINKLCKYLANTSLNRIVMLVQFWYLVTKTGTLILRVPENKMSIYRLRTLHTYISSLEEGGNVSSSIYGHLHYILNYNQVCIPLKGTARSFLGHIVRRKYYDVQ